MQVADEGQQPEEETRRGPEQPVRVRRRRAGPRSLKRSGDWGDRPELWDRDQIPLRGYVVAAIIVILIVVCLWLLLKGPAATALRPPDTAPAPGGAELDAVAAGQAKIRCRRCGHTFDAASAEMVYDS